MVHKVLASAVANARNNEQLDPDELYVSACYADEGTTLKRWRPRARGRATRIRKRTCHITVIVSRLPEDRLERRRARQSAATTACVPAGWRPRGAVRRAVTAPRRPRAVRDGLRDRGRGARHLLGRRRRGRLDAGDAEDSEVEAELVVGDEDEVDEDEVDTGESVSDEGAGTEADEEPWRKTPAPDAPGARRPEEHHQGRRGRRR